MNTMNRENPFVGINDVGEAEKIFNQFRLNEPDNDEGQRQMLNDLFEALMMPGIQIVGEETDFHNFAVTLAQLNNDNRKAYQIVSNGLTIHPTNTDLLADALMYGYNSGERDACVMHFNTLKGIEKKFWTWRAYSFSLNYMLDTISTKGSDIKESDIAELIEEFKTAFSDQEEPWISEFRVKDKLNNRREAIAVLTEADELLSFCPKCWLRYADILTDQGKFEEAAPIIKKLLRNPNSSEKVNTSYIHFLDGQCRYALWLASDDYDAGIIDEKTIRRIYRSFKLACNSAGLRESTHQRIQEYKARLELESGIEYEE